MASGHGPGEVTWVGVPGGRLAVGIFGSETEPVLAIHGISSLRKLRNWLRAAAPDLSLIAPDLRGRGDSTGVTLSSSIGGHAADMVLALAPETLAPETLA
jgi:pimeloyl-ACP methyl ester carboxylesterase